MHAWNRASFIQCLKIKKLTEPTNELGSRFLSTNIDTFSERSILAYVVQVLCISRLELTPQRTVKSGECFALSISHKWSEQLICSSIRMLNNSRFILSIILHKGNYGAHWKIPSASRCGMNKLSHKFLFKRWSPLYISLVKFVRATLAHAFLVFSLVKFD